MVLQVRHPDQKAKQNHTTFIKETKRKTLGLKKHSWTTRQNKYCEEHK